MNYQDGFLRDTCILFLKPTINELPRRFFKRFMHFIFKTNKLFDLYYTTSNLIQYRLYHNVFDYRFIYIC